MLKFRWLAPNSILLASLLSGCGTTPPTPQEAAARPATSAVDLSFSNKWRIEVSEGANSDGEIIFQVTPKGGTTQEVKVVVDDGESVASRATSRTPSRSSSTPAATTSRWTTARTCWSRRT